MPNNTPLYAISHWQEVFETAETRKLKHLRWVPVPNKHDGLGFRRIARERDRCELFTAWNLMVQVASKGPPEQRGKLQREDQPLSPEDLGDMTGFPATIFSRAFTFFSSPAMCWLTCEQSRELSASSASRPARSGETPESPAVSPGTPAGSPVIPASSPAEGKGMEGREIPSAAGGGGGGAEKPPKRPRERNPLFDALASECGHDPNALSKDEGSMIAKALNGIREGCPSLTPEEIKLRAGNYRKMWPNASLTPTALSKHWSRCGAQQQALALSTETAKEPTESDLITERDRILKLIQMNCDTTSMGVDEQTCRVKFRGKWLEDGTKCIRPENRDEYLECKKRWLELNNQLHFSKQQKWDDVKPF